MSTDPTTTPTPADKAIGKIRENFARLVTADQAWRELVAAAKAFAPHLDQWEKVKFQTEHGTVFLTIGRRDPYPDSFEEVP